MKRELMGLTGWHTEQYALDVLSRGVERCFVVFCRGPLIPVVPPKQVFKDRKSTLLSCQVTTAEMCLRVRSESREMVLVSH